MIGQRGNCPKRGEFFGGGLGPQVGNTSSQEKQDEVLGVYFLKIIDTKCLLRYVSHCK